MERELNNFVRIGSKSKNDYVASALFILEKIGEVRVEGLGSRKSKVLDISDRLAEIDGVEVGSPSIINVEGSSGIKIKARLEKGREPG